MSQSSFTGWRKAAASNGGGNCVEVARAASEMGVRDTKDRDGGTLVFGTSEWSAFLATLR